MNRSALGLAISGALASAWLTVSVAVPPALADSPTASSTEVNALVQDVKAHKQMCDKVDSSQAALSRQCANEHAALVARQKRLGVSDETLNGKLKTRGWRWP